jgi:hypothetical protein
MTVRLYMLRLKILPAVEEKTRHTTKHVTERQNMHEM